MGPEHALRESEERFQLVSRATRDCVWDMDLTTGRVWRNDPYFLSFGYTEDDFLPPQDAWQSRVHPEDLARVLAGQRGAREQGLETWADEYRFRRKDGSYAHVLDRCLIARDEQGRARRIVGAMQDVSHLRATEQALKESETRYRELFMSNPQPKFLFCPETFRVVSANHAAVRQYGYPEPELLEMTMKDLGPLGAPGETILARHTNHDGALMDVEIVWHRCRLGEHEAGLAVVTDVTEKKRAERELRESEERYRLLFERNPHPMWVRCLETNHFLAVNQAAVRHYGWSAREFLSMKASEVERSAERHLTKSGAVIDVEATSHDIHVLGKRARLVQVKDVTEAKRMAAALKTHERETQEILDTMQALIWYKDLKGKVVRCNRAAQGRPARGLSADERRVIRTGRPKLKVIVEEGETWWRKDIIPYRDADSRVRGVIVFAMDITEIKRAEEIQRRFVANVSHELRTPVAAIKGFAETLRAGALRDPRNRLRFVRIIESHADRLSWLVEDLLTISALEGGKKLAPAPLELGPVVRELIASVEPLAQGRRLTMKSRVSSKLNVKADLPHLRQALENLVSNAIKFNRPGGKVAVEARRVDGKARITVRDTGIGIAPEHHERVFDRFYRVKKGSEPGSSGLGLHIVKKIAEAHGGKAWLESRMCRGSAFHITVPLA